VPYLSTARVGTAVCDMSEMIPVARQSWQRTTTWGEALRRSIEDRRGLLRLVDQIRAELGEVIGARNTFAKLLKIETPGELEGADLLRAWVLLVAMGETPEAWGVDTAKAVPAGFDKDRLRATLPRFVAGAGFEPATSGLHEQFADVLRFPSGLTRFDLAEAA
jgi:hypothetical protein